MKTSLLSATLFISIISFGQTSLFTSQSITPSELTSQQSSIFNMLIDQNVYSSYQFVSTNYNAFLDDDGIVSVDMDYFIGQDPKLFRTANAKWDNTNDFKWYGNHHVPDSAAKSYGDFYLIRHNGKLIGNMNLDSLAFEIYDLTDGIQIILEKNTSLYADGMCDVDENNSEPNNKTTSACDNTKLRILFITTPDALTVEPDPVGKAKLVVWQLNNIYGNSQVYQKNAEFAGVYNSSLQQSTNISQDLDDWIPIVISSGVRSSYEADIVVFLTKPTYSPYSGWAKEIEAEKNTSFCIVTTATAADFRYVGAHEITHLMGGQHSDGGTAPYKGYFFKTGIWPFRTCRFTIMSNEHKDKARLSNLSNPNIMYKNKAMGDANHKVFEVVNDRYNYMSNLYPDPPLYINGTLSTSIGEPCNLQRTSTVNMTCGTAPYSYSWEKSYNGVSWYSLTSATTSSVTFQMPIPFPTGSISSNMMIRCNVTDAFGYTFAIQNSLYYFCDPVLNKTSSFEIEKINNVDFLVYPNPTEDEITLQVYSSINYKNASVKIHNITGQLLYQSKAIALEEGENDIIFNLEAFKLSKGIYIISLETSTKVFKQPIIKY